MSATTPELCLFVKKTERRKQRLELFQTAAFHYSKVIVLAARDLIGDVKQRGGYALSKKTNAIGCALVLSTNRQS